MRADGESCPQPGRKGSPGRGNQPELGDCPTPASEGFGRALVRRFPEPAFYPALGFSEWDFFLI